MRPLIILAISSILLPSSAAGGLMGIIVYSMRRAGLIQVLGLSVKQSFWADNVELFGLIISGVTCYFAVLFLVDRPGFKAVAAMAWQILVPDIMRGKIAAIRERFRLKG